MAKILRLGIEKESHSFCSALDIAYLCHYVAKIRQLGTEKEWFGIYESLLCVFICVGLLWLFREHGNWNSKFWQWCADQAYGAYIVHLLLMLILQHATDGIWMGAFGKFMFIGIVSTIASFVFTWLLRLIPGVKKVL